MWVADVKEGQPPALCWVLEGELIMVFIRWRLFFKKRMGDINKS